MTNLLSSLALATMAAGAILTLSLSPRVASVSAASGRNGEIHIVKNCAAYTGAAGDYCTITSSNFPEIPPNSTKVFYDQAFNVPTGMLDSNVFLSIGTGDWAVGRCTLDGTTNLGLCTFSDGAGPLSGFSARVNVSSADGLNYSWDGTYSYKP